MPGSGARDLGPVATAGSGARDLGPVGWTMVTSSVELAAGDRGADRFESAARTWACRCEGGSAAGSWGRPSLR